MVEVPLVNFSCKCVKKLWHKLKRRVYRRTAYLFIGSVDNWDLLPGVLEWCQGHGDGSFGQLSPDFFDCDDTMLGSFVISWVLWKVTLTNTREETQVVKQKHTITYFSLAFVGVCGASSAAEALCVSDLREV